MALLGKRGQDNPSNGLISSREPKTFAREPKSFSREPKVSSPYRDSIGAKAYLKDYEDKLAGEAKGADSSKNVPDRERANPWQYARQEARDARKTAMGNIQKGGSVKNRAKWKIISIIATGGIGVGAIFAPGAIAGFGIEQFANMIDQKFGSNLHALSTRRMNKMFLNRINDNKRVPSLKGMCGTVKVACRYGGMSNRAMKNFQERTGATINKGRGISGLIPGRSSIDTITYKGETMDAQTFYDRLMSNDARGQELRSMMQNAMKPKIAVWFNAKMTRLFSFLGIDKAGGFIKEKTTDKIKEKIKARQKAQLGSVDPKSLQENTNDKAANEKAQQANQNARNSVGGISDGKTFNGQTINPTNATEARNALSHLGSLSSGPGAVVSSIGKTLSVTGMADNACMALNTISAVGYISKMLGSQQLIRFTTTMLSARDGWKAGAATSEGFWDGLTRILFGKDPNSGKNAFESAGYAIMTGQIFDPTETMEFRTGGGFVGWLVNLKDTILSFIPGGSSACKIIQNPITRIGSLAVGIIASVFTFGGFDVGNAVANGALSMIIAAVISFMIPLAGNILTGNLVPDGIQGQAAGNATTSGAGALYGQNANAQGLSVMTKDQAVAFDKDVTQPYLAETQADDRAQAGLFDLGDPYSLTGSILSGWLPYISDNALSTVMNFGSLAANPLGLIGKALSPKANAATAADYYNVCADDDYASMNIATDPFCNPVYGIPDNNLTNMNPDDVMLWMLGKSSQMSEQYIPSSNVAGPSSPVTNTTAYIDNDGNPQGLYKDYVDHCAENTYPFGDPNENDADYIKSPDCRINSGHYPSMFYMYDFDDSTYQMMDCTLDEESGSCYGDQGSDTTNSTPSTGGGSATVIGSSSELASQILALNNDGTIRIMPGPKQELTVTASGSALSNGVTLSPILLAFIVDAVTTLKSQNGITMQINAIAGPINTYSPGTGHSSGSKHYQGLAVDFQCIQPESSFGTQRSVLDSIGSKYGILHNYEGCGSYGSNNHWHYSVGGN